jgi:hypothetical protein
MTKAELITEVTGKAWFAGTISAPEIDTEWPAFNLKLYRAHAKVEREENVLTHKHIYFYVFDEGGAGESAYYKDQNPDDQVEYVAP